ncbi:hypothetical protein ACVW0I_006067 [Bradyrhizobium sp. LM6.11]
MYFVFAISAGLIGAIISILIRMELQQPGLQISPTPYLQCVRDRSPSDPLYAHSGDDRWIGALDGAADDRRPGNGLSPDEQYIILAAAGFS